MRDLIPTMDFTPKYIRLLMVVIYIQVYTYISGTLPQDNSRKVLTVLERYRLKENLLPPLNKNQTNFEYMKMKTLDEAKSSHLLKSE